MSLSLYRKYRPQTFADVIGQKHIVQTLSNSILSNRVAHAYLFTGPRGTGKTTLARIFARAVNCTNPQNGNPCLQCEICTNIMQGKALDIFEIDAASNTGVDNIRELRENVKFPPSQAKFKVYIIDEIHMLSTGAFNALLKTLEEPPAHVIFILATTEIHKVPDTIISRCQRYDFTRLSLEHIVEKLASIAENEKITIEKNALEMLALAAEGGMRDAESLFAQVIATQDKDITASEVEEMLGTTKRQSLEALANFLFEKKATESISLVNQLAQAGYDLEVFNKSFVNYLRQLMLVSVDEKLSKLFSFELTTEQTKDLLKQAKKKSAQEILFLMQCFVEIGSKIKSSFIPQLPLEMAIIKAVSGQQTATPANSNPTLSTPPTAKPIVTTTPQIAPEPKIAPPTAPVAKSQVTAPPEITPTEPKNEPAEILQAQPIKNEAQIADSNFTLADVRKHWTQFVTDTKKINYSISAVLQSCKPVSAEYGILTIATEFPFYKDKLNEHANKLTIEGVFANILGLRLLIKVVTAQEAGIQIASSLPQQQPSANAGKPISAPSETSSLLSSAMGIMGGNIVQ